MTMIELSAFDVWCPDFGEDVADDGRVISARCASIAASHCARRLDENDDEHTTRVFYVRDHGGNVTRWDVIKRVSVDYVAREFP